MFPQLGVPQTPNLRPYLRTPPFVVDSPRGPVPVFCLLREDGTESRNLGLLLLYSDHLGAEALRPHASAFLEEDDDPIELANNTVFMYGMVTSPISNFKLPPNETVWNAHKRKVELQGAVAAGIVEDTGRRPPKQGYYDVEDLVVVRVLQVLHVDTKKFPNLAMLGYEKNCEWCERQTLNPMRCSACKQAHYCSEKCQKAAWQKTHKVFCPMITNQS